MSKTKLRSAEYSINEIAKKSNYKSYATKSDFKHILTKCVKELHELGFKVGHVKGFKAKHVYSLVEYWKQQGKSAGTIKNNMSKIRELGRLLGDDKLIKKDNSSYNIEGRIYKSGKTKAQFNLDISKCTDPFVKLSIQGQALFGLRREESMKIVIKDSIKDGFLILNPSWTKGGIGRKIPIKTIEQKNWIREVQSLVEPGHSLIRHDESYKNQLHRYIYQTRIMGVKNLHGLRHAYAQQRYKTLTSFYDKGKKGWDCPFLNGKNKDQMTDDEKNIDTKVRHILSREMGHSRSNITAVYLG